MAIDEVLEPCCIIRHNNFKLAEYFLLDRKVLTNGFDNQITHASSSMREAIAILPSISNVTS
jgi:hypothetical protein